MEVLIGLLEHGTGLVGEQSRGQQECRCDQQEADQARADPSQSDLLDPSGQRREGDRQRQRQGERHEDRGQQPRCPCDEQCRDPAKNRCLEVE